MDGYITTNEVAQWLGVKVETVRRWVRQGKLRGLPLGRAGYRIRREDFDRFVQQQPEHVRSEPSTHSVPASNIALSQLEAAATVTLERMSDGLLLFGLNGQCVYVNELAGHLLGRAPDELLGKTREQVLPHSIADERAGMDQNSFDYFSAKNSRWYQARTSATLQGECVLFFDVTERKLLEARLREREGQFSRLVEHLPDVIFRLDLHLRHLYISPIIEHITGYAPDTWLGKTGREMGMAAEACDRFEAFCQEAIRTGQEQSMEFDYKGGWQRSRIIPEYGSDGLVAALMGITEDITEHKRRELRTALITDLTEAFSHLSTQQEILNVAGEQMRQYFGVPSLTAAKVNEGANEFTIIYDSNDGTNVSKTQRLSDFANEDFLREMKAERVLVVNDVLSNSFTAAASENSPSFPVRAFVLASHVIKGQVDFVMGMQQLEPYTWREDEIELLQELLARIYPQLERVRAEGALRESRAEAERQRRFFEKIFDNLSSTVFIWDRQHRYAYINRTLEKLWGIEHGSAVGKTTAELGLNYSLETGKLITSQVEHVFEVGKDVISEMPYTSPSGVNGYFEYIFSPVFAIDGTVEFVAGISQDISKRKQMELALRESEQRVQAERQRLYDLFMTAPAAIMVTRGTEHIYEILNPLAVQYLGVHRPYIGIPGREAVPEAAEQGFFDLLDAVYQTGKPLIGNEVPAQFRSNDDGTMEQMYFNFVYQPSYNAAGKIDGVLGYINNVTETVLARKRIEESEAKYRTLFELMDEGFIIVDALFDEHDQPIDFFYLDVNPSAIRMLGRDYTGKRLREMDPNYESYWHEIVGRVAVTGQSERHELYATPLQSWYDFYAFKIGDADSRRVAVIFQDVTERKQLEQALLQANERFSLAEEAAQGFIYEWDLITGHVFRSRGMIKLLGYEPGEFLPTSMEWQALIHPEDLPFVEREGVLDLKSVRERYVMEYRVRHKSGRYVHVLDQGLALRDQRGAMKRIVGSTVDVTERKRMEQALRDSERRVQAERQRLYDLFMRAPAGIAVVQGPQHVYELANSLVLQILGTHRSIIGKPIREAVPDVEGQGFFELLDSVYQTGQTVTGNEIPAYLDRTGDGTVDEVYLNFVYQPSYNAEGEIDGVLTYANDVTDIVLARKRVEESEERFRTLANSMPQLVWSATASGEMDFFNERMNEYAEIPKNEEGIYQWQAILHPDDLENTKRVWEHAMRTGDTFENEQRMHMKDGAYRWHLVRGIPTYDADGSLLRWYGTKTDIEQLKRLEQQRTDFIGVVSHELKTPVTSAKAFAEVLENRFRKAGDERTATLLDKMCTQMDKLTRLISDLLDVTKIEAGKLQFHEDSFVFDELVDDILEEVQRTTTHTLQREGTTGATIYGDRERIGQVLINLLTNAIKYSPHAAKVMVSTSATEQEVTLCVRDFGIGIAKDKLPHVFERFFRETGAREDTFAGLGLGLYVACEIISRQGGKIWAESEKGQGSTFCFTLPIQGSKNTRHSNTMFDEDK